MSTTSVLNSLTTERNATRKLEQLEMNSIKSIRISGKRITLDTAIDRMANNPEALPVDDLVFAVLENSRHELKRMAHLEDENGDAPFSNGQIDAHKFIVAITADV